MIFDTDVVIWLLRADATAIQAVESTPERAISIVTFMELAQGLRAKREIRTIRQLLRDWEFTVLPLSATIGYVAASFIEQFAPSSGLDVPDALIAATAVEYSDTLTTANIRHFREIPRLTLKTFRPTRAQ